MTFVLHKHFPTIPARWWNLNLEVAKSADGTAWNRCSKAPFGIVVDEKRGNVAHDVASKILVGNIFWGF